MEDMHLSHSAYFNPSKLRTPKNKMQKNNQSILLANSKVKQILLDSAKKSYISKMAGKRTKQPRQRPISEEMAMGFETDPKGTKNKHIHFSSFRGMATEQIETSAISEEKMKYLYITSLTNHEGHKVDEQSGLVTCCDSFERRMFLCEATTPTTIEFYKIDYKGNPKQLYFCLNFDTINVDITYDDVPENNQISLSAGMYKLVLEHDNWQIIHEWYQRLMKLRRNSKSPDITLHLLENLEQFYKIRYQTEEYFVNNCQTGDIILFQDSHFFAKLQRFITGSDYDHVGLIIRDPTYGILIFEATSGSGVALTPWMYMISYKWYKTIPRIVWRRLVDVDRDSNFILTIQKFILQNLSKSYNISLAKITSAVSYIAPPKRNSLDETDVAKTQEDESGFFCSQLVATVYKELGLITRDRTNKNYLPACKFYPGDFAWKSGRELDRGRLSPEYQIYFEPQLLQQNYKFLADSTDTS